MPLVKIEMTKGNSKEFLLKFMDIVMETVVEVLQLPQDDRNIRLLEYESELFTMKPPYKYIIEISLFEGRTDETKRNLYKAIADNLEKTTKINRTELFILLNDQPKINWGVRGGLAASDIKLNFKTDI